jgi:hypothetical protein
MVSTKSCPMALPVRAGRSAKQAKNQLIGVSAVETQPVTTALPIPLAANAIGLLRPP